MTPEKWAITNPDVGGQAGPSIDYAQLDPGIRLVVARLRQWGFDTCDSGDGRSKTALGWKPDEFLAYPHVFAEVNPAFMSAEADRLKTLLESDGVILGDEEPAAHVEVTYDPVSRVAILSVVGLDDDIYIDKKKA